jgi:hypothetical protein
MNVAEWLLVGSRDVCVLFRVFRIVEDGHVVGPHEYFLKVVRMVLLRRWEKVDCNNYSLSYSRAMISGVD